MFRHLKKRYVRGVLAFGLLCLFCTAFEVAVIPTPSMERTVLVGDHLLINRLAFRWKRVQRGEVISFRSPRNEREVFLKRVIAVGGDRVEFRGDAVFVNGAPLLESYALHECRGCGERRESVVVPDGQLFVMGDNRDRSEDSRTWGTVPEKSVTGAPMLVLWSLAVPTEKWLKGSQLAVYLDHPLAHLRWGRFLRPL